MTKISISNINSVASISEFYELQQTAKKFLPEIDNPVYIELWNEEEFRLYFKYGKTFLHQPIGQDKLCEGFHNLTEMDGVLTHQIAIIMNENWRITLKHELFHVICSNLLGVNNWNMIADIYAERRPIDPFELTAILISDQDKIKLLKDKVEQNDKSN